MSTPDKEKLRQIEAMRHSWHEMLMRDAELRRFPTALALSTYVRQRFRADLNYAEFSIKGAAKALNMSTKSVVRARKRLIERAWIRLLERRMDQSQGWTANRYTLSGGPDDLLLEEHTPSGPGAAPDPHDTGDTHPSVIDDADPMS